MILSNVCEVKKWLRGVLCKKKELGLKMDFYKDLCGEFRDAKGFEKSIAYYKSEIKKCDDDIKIFLEDIKRLFNILDEDERMVLTARYISNIKWDYIELKVYYSRRQAIRIHERAVEKLVGQTVNI